MKVNKSNSKHISILSLTSGEFFGEDDILNNSLRTYRVICYSNKGKFFFLKIFFFINFRLIIDDEKKYFLKQNMRAQ